MEHVWNDCLSDPAGESMYIDIGYDGGMPKYLCTRGTSQLESYHKHIRKMMKASRISPELWMALIASFNYRWNTKAFIRNLGAYDYEFFAHWHLGRHFEENS